MINSVIINDKDNVIVAIEPIKKDEVVEYKDLDGEIKSLKALDDIKIYHKIAIKNIKIEQPVIKYGEHIGFAIKEIKIGEHVHDHNTEGRREDLEAIE